MSGSSDNSRKSGGNPPKLREIFLTAVISGGIAVLFTVLADSVQEFGTGIVLIVCAMISLAVTVLLLLGSHLPTQLRRSRATDTDPSTKKGLASSRVERMRLRLGRGLESLMRRLSAGYIGALLGAALVTVPWGVAQGGTWLSHRIWPPDCARPLELRVVTAPENVTVLRESIALFTRNKLVDGCAPYTISVGVAPSAGELAYAFGDNWYRDDARQESDEPFRRLYGPRADAWIATSTGEARLVADDVGTNGAILGIGPSVASDRLVIGMSSGRAERVRRELLPGPPGSHGLPVLWKVIRSTFDMPVNYPQPELSTAGLIAVSDLLLVTSAAGWEQSDIAVEHVTALLCRYRIANRGADDRELNRSPALVIPLHSLREYNNGRFNDPRCTGGAPSGMSKLKEFPSPGLSRLDYPFVTINWPNERNEERVAALGLLRNWLAANPLFSEGSREEGTVRSAKELRDAQGRFFGLLPRVDAEIALDVSGSMAAPHRSLLVRLRETFPDIKPLITPRDDFTLSSFSTVDGKTRFGEPHSAVGRDGFDDLTRSVTDITAEGSDAPISDMIMNLDGRAGPPGRDLVVVTDGGVFDNEPSGRSIGATLTRASNVNALYVLALGDNGCDRSPAREGKYRECVEAGSDMRQALRHVITSLREKERP